MLDNKVVIRIAEKVRAARLQKNMTIQQLATKSNLTKGLISKIENARTVPSLPVFISLTQSLDVSLKDFFSDMVLSNGKTYYLTRRSEFTSVVKENRPGFQYLHIISQPIRNCTMDAMILTIEPGAKSIPITTDGYEFKYVISGSCNYIINNEVIALEEGDALYFDASNPHVPVNETNKPVTMLVIYFLFS
jgi:transcriptional regulator with XRE-family HTH domain